MSNPVAARRLDRIVSALFATFGVFWMIASARQKYFVDTPHVSLSFLPFVSGAILAVLCGYIALRPDSAATRAEPLGDQEAEATPPGAMVRVALTFAALLGYAFVLPRVHALITTFVLVVVGLILSGEQVRVRLFVIAAIIALLLFAIFVIWLGVPLPGSRFS